MSQSSKKYHKQKEKERQQRKEELGDWWPFQKAYDKKTGQHVQTFVDETFEIWQNNKYQVLRRFVGEHPIMGKLWHLSIRRMDRGVMNRDWRDLQRIKNEMVGPEAEGVELFPAESRLVDTSNQYHLWVFETFKFPFGYKDRLVSDSGVDIGSVQRPFKEDERPADATFITQEMQDEAMRIQREVEDERRKQEMGD
jgi:hypothetical protein